MEETKVIYHIDEEETPYLVKLPISPDKVTLSDFKNVLNRPNYKFFFKSMDDDFGVVKEEIIDENAHLPCFNGRVVSWLVSAEGSNVSDGGTSQCTDTAELNKHNTRDNGLTTETESIISSRHKLPDQYNKYNNLRINGHSKHRTERGHGYETASVVSSELETTSFIDSDDDCSSRITTTTGRATNLTGTIDTGSRLHLSQRRRTQRRKRQTKHQAATMSRTSSFSSITDSTMSLNIMTVILNMDTVNFLGISIVGQSNKGGDGGIYVGSIMKGGAVALDGRIEPGDMILQVNDINFENMTNDEAVRVLRDVVQKPGPIKLVVAKCWDPNPKGYFTIPRTEPVRPIDPGAWIAHTAAVRGDAPAVRPPYARAASVSTLTSNSSSLTSSIPETERGPDDVHLTINSDMSLVVKTMARPDSGLEVRDRMWLKITIPNAFIGADVVEWLFTHVEGFAERREARKYAANLMKHGYIRHTVNKLSFSEQCYYVFGDLLSQEMSSLKIRDDCASLGQDTVGPLPPPARYMLPPDPPGHMAYAGTYMGAGYTPMPFNYSQDPSVYRDESLSGSSGSERLCKDVQQGSVGLDLMKSGGSTASDTDLNAHAPLPLLPTSRGSKSSGSEQSGRAPNVVHGNEDIGAKTTSSKPNGRPKTAEGNSPGNEEMELVIPADVLRRAGVDVTIAGLEGDGPHECSRKVKIVPDASLEQASKKGPYDIVILPGGLGGSKAFATSPAVGELLKQQEASGRTIGAICAAPTALKAHGIAPGKTITSYPSFENDLSGPYKYSKDRVVIDDQLITSQGPGTAFEFAIAIVQHLLGKEAAEKVTAPLLLKQS